MGGVVGIACGKSDVVVLVIQILYWGAEVFLCAFQILFLDVGSQFLKEFQGAYCGVYFYWGVVFAASGIELWGANLVFF